MCVIDPEFDEFVGQHFLHFPVYEIGNTKTMSGYVLGCLCVV